MGDTETTEGPPGPLERRRRPPRAVVITLAVAALLLVPYCIWSWTLPADNVFDEMCNCYVRANNPFPHSYGPLERMAGVETRITNDIFTPEFHAKFDGEHEAMKVIASRLGATSCAASFTVRNSWLHWWVWLNYPAAGGMVVARVDGTYLNGRISTTIAEAAFFPSEDAEGNEFDASSSRKQQREIGISEASALCGRALIGDLDSANYRFLDEVLVPSFLEATIWPPSRFSADDWGDVTILPVEMSGDDAWSLLEEDALDEEDA